MLGVVGSNLTIFRLQPATPRNTVAKRMQDVAPNNVAIFCVGMLRSFDWGFIKGKISLICKAFNQILWITSGRKT